MIILFAILSAGIALFNPQRKIVIFPLIALSMFVSILWGVDQGWGVYHYYLGSKFFKELGYFHLYDCTVEATQANGITRRDLWDYSFTNSEFVDCPTYKFTPERWNEFQAYHYLNDYDPSYLRDKGLNATPTWIAIAQLFHGMPLWVITHLDTVVIIGALAVVWWQLGWKQACMSALFMLLFYGTVSRLFGHFGQWWWLGLLLAANALKSRYCRLSGLMMGLSVSLAVFPVFMLLYQPRRIVAYGIVGLVAGLVIGLFTARGIMAYPEFLDNMVLHSGHIASEPFNVGLRNFLTLVNAPDYDAWLVCFRGGFCMEKYSHNTAWELYIPALLMFVLLMRQSRYAAMYATITLSRYYWQILALSPTRLLFGANALIIVWQAVDRDQAYRWDGIIWIGYFVAEWAVNNPPDCGDSEWAIVG